MTRLCLLACAAAALAALPAAAQHHAHPAPPADASAPPDSVTETFEATGLRVDPAALPAGSAIGRAGIRWADGGYATVVYGRPFTRGRQVFGGLVAWDSVWAAGAHRATELWTTVPLVVGGAALPAGGYHLFITPRGGRWTLHVQPATGMHLADEYDAAHDLVALDVAPATRAEATEALTWSWTPDGRALVLRWADAEVTFPLGRGR